MPLNYGLIHAVDLTLARLPLALQGFRIGHLTDLHVRRPRRRYEQLATHLSAVRLDLLAITGDMMSHPGDEAVALEVLGRILQRVRPRWGAVGVWGNHDSAAFREQAAALPVRWLEDQVLRLDDVCLEIGGLGHPADAVALARRLGPRRQDVLRLAMVHVPEALPSLADLGVDLMLAGHTHGGQVRLPGGRALRNSTWLPLSLTSGLLRHRDTLGVISRGVGEINLPFRLFCAPQAPLYTLRQGPLPGAATDEIAMLEAW